MIEIRIVCAANKHINGNERLVGVRHWGEEMRAQFATLNTACQIRNLKYINLNDKPIKSQDFIQGFIDNKGNFHTREEALIIAKKANQIIKKTFPENQLFSEDLY